MFLQNKKGIACYHWWLYDGEPQPYNNLRTPIILSIATLRAVTDMPIIVYDLSDSKVDWLNFADKLNFKIIKIKNCFYESKKHSIKGWRYLSRIPDINNQMKDCCDTIMYCDSDTFWLNKPQRFSMNADKFCYDGYNTGFFYYCPRSEFNQKFHQLFVQYTDLAIVSFKFREEVKKELWYDNHWYDVWDEMILAYMHKKHPELFNIIPVTDHTMAKTLCWVNDMTKVKMFHVNGIQVSNVVCDYSKHVDPNRGIHARGIMCLSIKEFYENMCKTLNQSDIDIIFTKAEQEYYIPRQISLLNDSKRLIATKDEEGYHLQKCFS